MKQGGVYIGLGTNLGDRTKNLSCARKLCAKFLNIAAESSVIETPALLPENAGDDWDMPFLNQVIEVKTDLSPHALLHRLQQVERQMGRREHRRWEPRVIDLDILIYGDEFLFDADLAVPHPQMHHRDFVLAPLLEIAPDWVFPSKHALAGKRAADLLSMNKANEKRRCDAA